MRREITTLLDELNALDEHERIEAKGGTAGDLGKAVNATISAFSNEPGLDGGYVVFGLSRDEDGAYTAVGVADPDRLQTELQSRCNGAFNIAVRPKISVEEVEGKVPVAAYIPKAEPSRKPVFLKTQGLPKGAYRRIGSADTKCTDEDVALLFDRRNTTSFDAAPVEATLQDLDIDAVGWFRAAIVRSNPESELADLDLTELLCALKATVRRDGVDVPTVAGMLMFGSRLALRREFPMAARVDTLSSDR